MTQYTNNTHATKLESALSPSCRSAPLTMKLAAALLLLLAVLQICAACTDCIAISKEERAMLRTHSGACSSVSKLDMSSPELRALLSGEQVDSPALRAHVYCVLQRCKVVGKDGKLLKSTVLGKIGTRAGGKNATKMLENCVGEQRADSPEDAAWNLFKCGFSKKGGLLHHMMPGAPDTSDTDNHDH